MKHEKNRYLRLDASPLEHGQVKRFFAPGALSVAFLVGVIGTTKLEIEDIGSLIPATIYTGFGLAQRRFLGFASNIGWMAQYHKYVIDMRPNTATVHNPPPYYGITAVYNAAINTLTPLACIVRGTTDLTIDLPIQLPTFMNGIGQVMAYRNVKNGKWKIIKMTDMEPDKSLSCEPQLKFS